MCAQDQPCSSYAPGHALHLIQSRLVAATPAEWRDAIVTAVDTVERVVDLQPLDGGAAVRVWTAAGATLPTPGDPVAVHLRYHALAAGPERVNVAVL
jgi:hypothetical protein